MHWLHHLLSYQKWLEPFTLTAGQNDARYPSIIIPLPLRTGVTGAAPERLPMEFQNSG
jgi:hypothetical protein